MTSLKMAAAAALLTFIPINAMAAEMPSGEQCDAWFMKVDTNGDGTLGQQEEVTKYADMITKASASSDNSSGNAMATLIKKEDWVKYCAKGTFGMPSP
jgi:hypothetical protein